MIVLKSQTRAIWSVLFSQTRGLSSILTRSSIQHCVLGLWTFVLEEFGYNVPDYISSLDLDGKSSLYFLLRIKRPATCYANKGEEKVLKTDTFDTCREKL